MPLMCLDYLWVSNPYGPSTTQPRPKIKTFLRAQATLILFNVPAPYNTCRHTQSTIPLETVDAHEGS